MIFRKLHFPLLMPSLVLNLLVFFAPNSLSSQVQISENFRQATIASQVEFSEDATNELTIEQMILGKHSFQKIKSKNINFGYSDSSYWLRFKVSSVLEKEQTVYLELLYPLIDYFDVYLISKGKVLSKALIGDHFYFEKRRIKHRNFITPIVLPKKGLYEVYLRIQTSSSVQVPIVLRNNVNLLNYLNENQMAFGVYYGIMFAMFLYNLFIYLGVREKAYLFYLLYLASYILFQGTVNGLGFQYIWPESIWWNGISLPVFIALSSSFAIQFMKEFLNTKEKNPRFTKILESFNVVALLIIILNFTLGYSVGIKLAILFVSISSITLLITGIVFLIKGYKTARFFVLAWVTLLAGVLAYVLKTVNILPTNFLTEHAIQLGSLAEVTLLSLALVDRINQLKEDKENIQQNLILMQRDSLSKQDLMLESFSRFVPKEFLFHLGIEDITSIRPGDHVQKEMSIFFSDIRSFTQLSEGMSPEDNFKFLNSYLKRMAPIVKKHNGFIDKFIGDAIMALFPKDADSAVKACIEMQQEIRKYNKFRMKSGYDPINVGMGVHTGKITLGTIGQSERLEGTVISDAVNLASRIESLTKKMSCSILISESTLYRLTDPTLYQNRLLGRIRVKGKKNDVVVYEIFDGLSKFIIDLKNEGKYKFEKGVNYFFQKSYDKAVECFIDVARMNPLDGAAKRYIHAIIKRNNMKS